uniref:Transcription factor GTE10 n=1 Tax=Anthurium amnicola TaxID=1678845 RepID=A0A1D1Z9E8_9ARAE
MAPTVLLEYTKQKSYQDPPFTMMGKTHKFPRGHSSGFVPDYRHTVETVGESEGFVSSGRIDSEDSSAPKRKCISLNIDRCDGFNVPMQVVSISKMSSSERKELELRLRSELEQIQILQKKILSRAVNGVAVSSTTDASGKKRPAAGQNASQLKRGHSGRFEPGKSAPPPPVSSSTNAALIRQCQQLLKRLLQHPFSWVFSEPVDIVKLNIPDYYTIIKHPMDLGTIKNKLTSGTYASLLDFASDVRLTFTNAKIYNPPGNDVHTIANEMNELFELKWKHIEKKIASLDSNVAREAEVVRPPAQMKKRKAPLVNHTPVVPAIAECVKNEVERPKEKMTAEEKQKLSGQLESLISELPFHIVEFLRRNSGNQSQSSEDEIEIDIDALGDDTLFELRKLLDEFCSVKGSKQERKAEPGEMEIFNESGISNSSMQPYKGNEPPADEEVDIVGNDVPASSYPPVEIDKDTALRSSKYSSSSGSSSDSGSSSSDSDSATSSGSESLDAKGSTPTNNLKEIALSGTSFDQEKSDMMNQMDANRSVGDGSEQLEQRVHLKAASAEVDGCQVGGNGPPERQVSPEKLYRAALLRSRFADTILKAREKTLDTVG